MVWYRFFKSLKPIIMLSLIAGCNFQSAQEGTTPNGPATVAARTLEVVFTKMASQTEQIEEGTRTPSSNIEGVEVPSSTTEETCTNRALFVEDITIRDNMHVEGGASFIKTWRLRNDGTCIWNRSYSLTFFRGERMGAPTTISLSEIVQPGQAVDISIDMTAPKSLGMHQGFWRLQTEKGDYFGIGSSGDHSFWVKITVTASLTASPTLALTPTFTPSNMPPPSETPTPTPSPQPTPSVYTQGESQLMLNQGIDLDDGRISPEEGEDIILLEIATSEYSLSPQTSVLIATYSGEQTPPTPSDCENTPLTSDPISLTSLAADGILCYITDEGRPGYLSITALNSSIDFNFITWVP